jgi:VWFA-related protein
MQLRRFSLATAVALVLGTSGAAQAPQTPQAPPSVTFQVEVNYVDVDAVVTDQNGAFVSGLTRDDFEVFEDGKPQKIDMFSYVELPVERVVRFAPLNRPVTSDVRSNERTFDGRVYVLVMDDLDISPLRTSIVKQSAREFIEQHFGANDIAAVVYTSGRSDATQDFTNDRSLLVAAIDKFIGRRLQSAAIEALDRHYQNELTKGLGDRDYELAPNPNANVKDAAAPVNIRDMEREQRTYAVLDTLKNLGEFMAGVRGRRKAVLLFSEGLEIPMSENLRRAHRYRCRGRHQGRDHGGRAIERELLRPRSARAHRHDQRVHRDRRIARARSSAGRVRLVERPAGHADRHEGLAGQPADALEETGGFAAVNLNMLGSAFARIVDLNSRYYVLGYYPPSSARDGRFHRIEVRTKRDGLRVSARRGYASPRGRTPTERKRDEEARRSREARRGGVNNMSAELREALNAPLYRSGLAFSVHAAPFRLNQKEASVALAIELDGARLQFAQKGDGLFANNLEVSFFGINQDGRARRTTRSEMNLALRPDSFKRVQGGGLRLNPRMTLEPGRYQIRVGIRDSNARVGTVFHELVVPDFRSDPVMLSGMLLTAASAGTAMTAQPDPDAPKALPGPAISRRIFSQNDTLTVFAEIYDNISSQQPRQIETVVSLISETGQEVVNARDSFPTLRLRSGQPFDCARGNAAVTGPPTGLHARFP